CSWSMAKPGSASTAAAIALPMRPSGANRLRRIGWSAERMARSWRKRGRRATAAPGIRSSRPELLLQQHVALQVAIGCALTAPGHRLAGGLRQERVRFLLPCDIFGRRRHMVENRDEIEIGLRVAGVHVGEDVIALDPPLRFLEFHVLAKLTGEKVGIIAEMAVI